MVRSFVERWCESRAWWIDLRGTDPMVDNAIAVSENAAASTPVTHQRDLKLVELKNDVAERIIDREDLVDRKSTRLNSSHSGEARMPSSA